MPTDRLRAPILWLGGKGKMITKLMRHVPLGGKPYCEPYMGAATLFFARPPAPVEVLNDLDGDLVNLFRCLQNPQTFAELRHRLLYTLYARSEYCRAVEILNAPSVNDPVMRAWAFFVAHNLSINSIAKNAGSWGRAFVSQCGIADTTNKWIMRLSMLDDWHKRLLPVQIDNRDALEVIRYWDTPNTVFYVDPPYHPSTRICKKIYAVEPDHNHYVELVQTLLACRGAVVLSCYDHPVFAPLAEAGWQKTEYNTVCFAAARVRNSDLQGAGGLWRKVPRTEVIWSNLKAVEAVNNASLFQVTDSARA
jgi:DNA adenine methylase